MKIVFRIDTRDGRIINIPGELVDVAPHLASVATFVVHRYPTVLSKWWRVSNIESGRYVDFGRTKVEAIRKGTEVLRPITVEKMLATYRNHGVT